MLPLLFEARSLPTSEGVVLCTLYATEASWLSDPGYFATTSATPAGDRALCRFENVPAGAYAVTFLQDVNRNGDMDTNLFGLPREPWGTSRDAPARFGPPLFEDARFVHPAPAVPFGHAR
jgi:uncharacterized protein (DUF2141 family)